MRDPVMNIGGFESVNIEKRFYVGGLRLIRTKEAEGAVQRVVPTSGRVEND